MMTVIENLPSNIVGFKATGTITEKDFSDVVLPKVDALIAKTDQLNYLLVLDTSLKNFTAGAWFQDAIMGLKHLTKWNRAAIVSDVEAIRTFTKLFSVLIPGEFKGFEHKQMQEAIQWTSEEDLIGS